MDGKGIVHIRGHLHHRAAAVRAAQRRTRGLDVGAIENIHRQIIQQRDSNKAVLLVSFELDEVFGLADRILVMFNGKIVGEFKPNEVTPEELGLYMVGSKDNYVFKEEVKNEIQ